MKLIRNANVLNESTGDLHLQDILYDQKIIAITEPGEKQEAEKVIDLEGKLLIPGCIDPHVHFNDPGYTHHEDFLSGTSAAAAGGITTIIDMPCTSLPPVTDVTNLQEKLAVISSKALIDFALWGGIRKEDFPYNNGNIPELWKAGVVGFKIYTISGMEKFQSLSYTQIKHVFQKFPDSLYAFHAEDEDLINAALEKFSEQELAEWQNFTGIRSVEAEYTAVKNIISVMQNNSVHFVHISSKQAAELIIKAKKNNDISLETCPHYLQFSAPDFARLKGKLKTTPPVKFPEDKAFLRRSLIAGDLDFIATDHAGCDFRTEKDLDDFYKIYSGIPGTQLLIPYLFTEFYLKEQVPIERMIQLTSAHQAKRYGLFPEKGSLQIGTDADFTILDLNRNFTVNEQDLLSLGKYSPLHGEKLSCSVDHTIVRGEVIYDHCKGITGKAGYGNFLKRKC